MSASVSSRSKISVLGDAFAVSRLRDHRYVALDAPAEEHLRRCPPEPLCDPRHRLARDVAPATERAVGLEHDAVPLARIEERCAVLVGAELNLVHGRRDVRRPQQLSQLHDVEVGDSDRACVGALAGALHSGPRPGGTAPRPVDDVEVDVVETQASETRLGLGDRIPAPGMELRRDEYLVARDPALAQGAPDALLVAVGLGSVDVAIAELERPADGVHALGPVRDLPHAEAEQRDRVAIRE
jgi:hypothetical protein